MIDEWAISIEFIEFNQLKYGALYTVQTASVCKHRTYFSINQERQCHMKITIGYYVKRQRTKK
jgi:hypothetical protein